MLCWTACKRRSDIRFPPPRITSLNATCSSTADQSVVASVFCASESPCRSGEVCVYSCVPAASCHSSTCVQDTAGVLMTCAVARRAGLRSRDIETTNHAVRKSQHSATLDGCSDSHHNRAVAINAAAPTSSDSALHDCFDCCILPPSSLRISTCSAASDDVEAVTIHLRVKPQH
jgi:hypothetical protein